MKKNRKQKLADKRANTRITAKMNPTNKPVPQLCSGQRYHRWCSLPAIHYVHGRFFCQDCMDAFLSRFEYNQYRASVYKGIDTNPVITWTSSRVLKELRSKRMEEQ